MSDETLAESDMPKLGPEPFMHPHAHVQNAKLGSYVEIGEGARILARILESTIGNYSYTDRYADIAYSFLGKFVNVAAFSRINPGEHPLHRASLHHFMYRSSYYWPEETDEQLVFDWRRSRPVHIGHDTWIGHGAIIMKGVTVGNGAVIASNAVVTKNVPPYAIVGGLPAKIIKWRHPPQVADRLQAMAWWDWDHETLRVALPDFRALSADAFIEKHGCQAPKNIVTQALQSVA